MSNFICVIKHTVICRQATMGQKKEAAGDWNSSGVKLDSLDIVRDTTAAIRKRRKYLQAQLRVNEGTEYCLTPVTAKLSVTLSAAIKPHSLPLWRLRIINNAFTTAVQALLMIRRRLQGRERGWTAAENATDSFCATLLLLGLEGKGTFTHANWSEGWNIAFAFDELPCIDSESPVSRLTVSCPHAHYLTAVDLSHALVCQYALSWLYIRGKFMPSGFQVDHVFEDANCKSCGFARASSESLMRPQQNLMLVPSIGGSDSSYAMNRLRVSYSHTVTLCLLVLKQKTLPFLHAWLHVAGMHLRTS